MEVSKSNKARVLMERALILFVNVFYCSQSKNIASPGLLTTSPSIGYAPWIPITHDPDKGQQPLNEQWQEDDDYHMTPNGFAIYGLQAEIKS